jgi:photosystem II stability/assembly factor-like uncharacterized protein
MRPLPFLLALLLLTGSVTAAPRRRASAPPAPFPSCSMITGTAAVTFTRDGGETFTRAAESLSGIGYTYGLAVLDAPNTLLAFHKQSLLTTTDAGCSWRTVWQSEANEDIFPPRITPAKGGRAYIWSDNRRFLLRYDFRGVRVLKAPGAIIGFGTDPVSGEEVRAGDADGVIWRSSDGGESWELGGRTTPSTNTSLIYRVAFDPKDLDHIVAGTVINGALVSRDGGRSWQQAKGLAPRAANTFNLVFSPVSSDRVWAMSLDLDESNANGPSHGRHIYVSDDGGSTYRAVVDEAPGVKLINGPTMAADPRDGNVLWFVFGTNTMGYGTDLFRYDLARDELTMTHSDFHDINAIEFSPFDPHLMYVGLEFVGSHSESLQPQPR